MEAAKALQAVGIVLLIASVVSCTADALSFGMGAAAFLGSLLVWLLGRMLESLR